MILSAFRWTVNLCDYGWHHDGRLTRKLGEYPNEGIAMTAREVVTSGLTLDTQHIADLVDNWWSASYPAQAARQVIAAAVELFAQRGYHATSTRHIAHRVDMSTGAIYSYFRTKEELLFEIVHAGHQRGVDALEAGLASSSDPQVQLAAMVRGFTRWHARFHTVAKIVHDELYSLSDEHLATVVELRRRTQSMTEAVIERGYCAGVFDPPDVTNTARALLSLCIDVARWYRREHAASADQIADLYVELSLRMVASRTR